MERGFGWLPALRAPMVCSERWSSTASAICDRAELPVHRNNTRGLPAREGVDGVGGSWPRRTPGCNAIPASTNIFRQRARSIL